MAQRIALIIGASRYHDPVLASLARPEINFDELAAVLRDPGIGNFNTVEMAVDRPAGELRRRIEALFHWTKRTDRLLLYLAGKVLLIYALFYWVLE